MELGTTLNSLGILAAGLFTLLVLALAWLWAD